MKKLWKKYRIIALFYTVSITIGLCYGMMIINKLNDVNLLSFISSIVVSMTLLCVTFLLQIVLHEMGHMLAGLLRGWKVLSFMLFGFIISRQNGRFNISRFNIAGAGGQCLMLPPEQGDTRNGIIFYNAGGILMNFIVTLIALGGLLLCWESLTFEQTSLLTGFVFTGLISSMINGIPLESTNIPNDGKNILTLKKDALSTEIFVKSLRLVGLMQQGQTLLEVNQEYFCTERTIDYSNPIHAMALSYDLSLAIARHDFEQAHRIFGRIKLHSTDIIPFYWNEIRMEATYLYLVAPLPHVQVEHLIDDALKQHVYQQISFRPTALRVIYAWNHLLYKNEKEAEQQYAQFKKVCQQYYIPGEVPTEQELIDWARQLPPVEKTLSLETT